MSYIDSIMLFAFLKPNRYPAASDNFLIFIGIILLLALAGIIAVPVIKKIRNKNK